MSHDTGDFSITMKKYSIKITTSLLKYTHQMLLATSIRFGLPVSKSVISIYSLSASSPAISLLRRFTT